MLKISNKKGTEYQIVLETGLNFFLHKEINFVWKDTELGWKNEKKLHPKQMKLE